MKYKQKLNNVKSRRMTNGSSSILKYSLVTSKPAMTMTRLATASQSSFKASEDLVSILFSTLCRCYETRGRRMIVCQSSVHVLKPTVEGALKALGLSAFICVTDYAVLKG